jgi:branched-chain amino acid transport system substrate-binding protein
MKMNALTDVIAADQGIKSVYILGQDYSFGKAVADGAVKFLGEKRPDIQIVGNELHPIGKVKDFSPYVAKIKAAGAQALITGNWGADMLNLSKAISDAGLQIPVFTYYAAGSGITKAIGASGVGTVKVVAEGAENPPHTETWANTMKTFKGEYADGNMDQPRIANVIGMLSAAINQAGSAKPIDVAKALEGMKFTSQWGDALEMRASDHQLQMPVRIFDHTDKNVVFDMDGSGYGLVEAATISAKDSATSTTCKMERPTS